MEIMIPGSFQRKFSLGKMLMVKWKIEPNITARSSLKCRQRIYKEVY